jgi:hypothetical protein
VAMPMRELCAALRDNGRLVGPLAALAVRPTLELLARAAHLQHGHDLMLSNPGDGGTDNGWIVLRGPTELRALASQPDDVVLAAFASSVEEERRASGNGWPEQPTEPSHGVGSVPEPGTGGAAAMVRDDESKLVVGEVSTCALNTGMSVSPRVFTRVADVTDASNRDVAEAAAASRIQAHQRRRSRQERVGRQRQRKEADEGLGERHGERPLPKSNLPLPVATAQPTSWLASEPRREEVRREEARREEQQEAAMRIQAWQRNRSRDRGAPTLSGLSLLPDEPLMLVEAGDAEVGDAEAGHAEVGHAEAGHAEGTAKDAADSAEGSKVSSSVREKSEAAPSPSEGARAAGAADHREHAQPIIPPLTLPVRPALSAPAADAVRGLTDEELRGTRRVFHKFDIDGDGVVSWDDFRVAMERLEAHSGHASNPAALRAMFDAVDTDGDGLVHFDEFVFMEARKRQAATPAAAPSASAMTPPISSPKQTTMRSPHRLQLFDRESPSQPPRRLPAASGPAEGAGAALHAQVGSLRSTVAPVVPATRAASALQSRGAGTATAPPESFASAVLSTYAHAQPGADGRLGAESWVALLEAVGAQRGLHLPRDQLLAMFEAARQEGSPTVDLASVMAMPSVGRFFADIESRHAARIAQARMAQQQMMIQQAQHQAQYRAQQQAQQLTHYAHHHAQQQSQQPLPPPLPPPLPQQQQQQAMLQYQHAQQQHLLRLRAQQQQQQPGRQPTLRQQPATRQQHAMRQQTARQQPTQPRASQQRRPRAAQLARPP